MNRWLCWRAVTVMGPPVVVGLAAAVVTRAQATPGNAGDAGATGYDFRR